MYSYRVEEHKDGFVIKRKKEGQIFWRYLFLQYDYEIYNFWDYWLPSFMCMFTVFENEYLAEEYRIDNGLMDEYELEQIKEIRRLELLYGNEETLDEDSRRLKWLIEMP